MRGFVVRERTACQCNFADTSVVCTIGVTHGQCSAGEGDEDGLATLPCGIFVNAVCVGFVEVDGRAEGQAVVSNAGQCEADVEVGEELRVAAVERSSR